MVVVVALAVGGLAAGASAGPDKPIAHVKTLAGEWRAVGGASAASIRIKADGTYEGTSANGAKTTGRITATGGKASFRSATAAGSVMLSQEGGKDMLTFVTADGRSSAKLQRVK
ncbi:MAG TPA: hypothetical protein VIG07_11900 [Methylomirabilota bacterium]|jgi:hypothetical protein